MSEPVNVLAVLYQVRSARYVVMNLPAKYSYKDVYEKCLA